MSLLVTLAYVHSNSLLQAWIGISKFPLAQGVLENGLFSSESLVRMLAKVQFKVKPKVSQQASSYSVSASAHFI